jgi:hypothetical protein
LSKKAGPVVHLFSRAELRQLIRRHGLLIHRFDTSLLYLDWDGLEYQFRILNGRIFLETIVIRSDVILGRVDIHENDVYENWVHLSFW